MAAVIICSDWLGMHIWFSLIGQKLEIEVKLEKLLIVNQVLAILSHYFQGWLFDFLGRFIEIVVRLLELIIIDRKLSS